MELAGRGETAAALAEFDTLLANDPDYTAGYFMAAQTLANGGPDGRGDRAAEGRDRLRRAQRQPPCAERDAGHAGRTGAVSLFVLGSCSSVAL